MESVLGIQASLHELFQVMSSNAFRVCSDLDRGAFCNDLPAALSAFRSKVNDPVCGFDHVEIVLDDHYGVSLVAQFL